MMNKASLLIIGNSNVGKSSITKLLLPRPSEYKGKTGKKPGSTLLIKEITQPALPYNIVDMPGFGYMKGSSRRREEHIKNQIVSHIENHYLDFFLSIVVINILRIEDELKKYFIQHKTTIPLSFELITFLEEFRIPLLVVVNKIDKVSNRDKERIVSFLVQTAKDYQIELINIEAYNQNQAASKIPYLEFSALKKINLGKLNYFIDLCLSKKN